MATVTDLTKNTVSVVDQTSQDTSGQVHDDSNINAFEFANLLLAGLLPTVISIINFIADYAGNLVSAGDITESTVSTEDDTVSSISLQDLGGSAITGTDVSVEAITQQDFGGVVVSGSDVSVSTMTISDTSGNSNSLQDNSASNSHTYDFADFTYEQTTINYDGYPVQGVVVDISGS